MTRMSKQGERRNMSPRKRHYKPDMTTGPKKDNLPKGYREHPSALDADKVSFIPKIK